VAAVRTWAPLQAGVREGTVPIREKTHPQSLDGAQRTMTPTSALSWVACPPLTPATTRRSPVTAQKRPRRPPHSRRPAAACALSPRAPAARPAIRVLPRAVVQRIAAGEVLRGVSCVVRELVENALDASAGSVAVDIDPGVCGVTSSDDGAGMDEEAVTCAAECNATSKLRGVGGLEEIATLGFRGQGLWAIAGVAGKGLVVMSRVRGADVGARVVFREDGGVKEAGRCAMRVGTVCCAEGLPWGFDAVEVREARRWLERTALVWPAVSMSLSVKGKTVWRSGAYGGAGSDDGMLASFAGFVGRSAADFRRAGVADAKGLGGGVDVVVGVPGRVHFGDVGRIVVAINGRCVSLPDVEKRVRAAFRSLLPPRRHPAVFVRIRATRRAVCDWNISPVKSTMRLRGSDAPALVARAVELALGSDFVPLDDVSDGAQIPAGVLAAAAAEARAAAEPAGAVAALLARSRDAREREEMTAFDALGDADDGGVLADAGLGPGMASIKAIAQTLGTYILAEHNGSGLFLIEQHVAHERVLYEELVDTWATSFIALPADRVVTLPAALACDDERLLALSSLGFSLALDSNAARILTAPKPIAALPPPELTAALRALAAAGEGGVHAAAARLACRAAVRNGAPLGRRAMERLVARLARCRAPHTCPHGRPVFVELGAAELATLFRRRYSPQARGQGRRPRRTGGVL
jgi:DNA mismatch repair protein MutL